MCPLTADTVIESEEKRKVIISSSEFKPGHASKAAKPATLCLSPVRRKKKMISFSKV